MGNGRMVRVSREFDELLRNISRDLEHSTGRRCSLVKASDFLAGEWKRSKRKKR